MKIPGRAAAVGRGLRRDDGGFTLIELVITIVILGVITIPLANLVISYFTNTSTTTGRLSESHDAQIVTTYFAQDVASAGIRATSSPYAVAQSIWTSPFPGGSCGASIAGTQLVLLRWDDTSWDSTAQTQTTTVKSAGYVVETVSGQVQLHRIFCSASTQLSDIVVAHDVDPAVAKQVVCSPSPTCTDPSVTTVTMQLGIKDPSGKGQPYALAVTGQRRQSSS